MNIKINSKRLFIYFLLIIFLTNIMIILNIPILRQIFAFILLTILPGLVGLEVLKLKNLNKTEKFVLSIGLSISLLLIYGLIINNILWNIGYKQALSTETILIFLNLILILLGLLAYKLNKNEVYSLELDIISSEKLLLIPPIFFITLSLIGTYLMNTLNNNLVLILLFSLISFYVILLSIFHEKVPNRLYPLIILLVGLSLIIILPLRSTHILGVDTFKEYFYFQVTNNNLHWNIIEYSTLDSCIVISLLPTIYVSLTSINPETVFKFIYPILFSISPVIIYLISKKYVGEFYGFLSSLFFMFQYGFILTAVEARTNIAILFFALTLMVLFNYNIKTYKKTFLSILFIFSCILSHYATAYIFLFMVIVTFVIYKIFSKDNKHSIITLGLILLMFSTIFLWYSQITQGAFDSAINFLKLTFINLNNFLSNDLMSDSTKLVLGQGVSNKGIPQKIEFILTWLNFILIAFGIFYVILQSIFPSKLDISNFLKEKFEIEYLGMIISSAVLISLLILLPYVSINYNIDRVYSIALVILSVVFVIGAIKLSSYIKLSPWIIILLLILPYFLTITGVTYEVFGVPQSMILNSKGNQYDIFDMNDQEFYGAKWLEQHNDKNQKILTDHYGMYRVISQMRPGRVVDEKSIFRFIDTPTKLQGTYIYLSRFDVKNEVITSNETISIRDAQVFFESNKIYDDGIKIYSI